MDEIEGAVLSGLQRHLKAPHLLKEFARSYEEERKRLAGEKHRRRAQLERKLGQIQRATDRLWADYETERVSMDIAGPKLKEFHTQKSAIEAEISETPEDEKIVGLHPAALREYGRHVEQLQSVFSEGVTQDLAEAAGKIRNLVARVTLIPQENGFKIELEGRLALLMQAPKL